MFFGNDQAGDGGLGQDYFFSENYHNTASDVNQPFRADSWEEYNEEEDEGEDLDGDDTTPRKDYYYYSNMKDNHQGSNHEGQQ